MYVGKTLFAQIMEFVPWTSFGRIVDRYGGNSGVRRLSCAEQFRVMAFAQLTWRESLRDIEVTLGANANKLYAMGLRNTVRRSTLADANEDRLAIIASLLELGPRMGLHASVAPALTSTLVAGRTLGARMTVDSIDSSPPLRLRSDRDAYDAVDVVLYRRGRVLLLCQLA